MRIFTAAVTTFLSAKSMAIQRQPTANVSYFGGPIVPNIQVFVLFWEMPADPVPKKTRIIEAYKSMVCSKLMENLAEYSILGHTIGNGSFIGSYTVSNSGQRIIESKIEETLKGLITMKTIPQQTENSYYAIHFGPNKRNCQSCQYWCAYHGSFKARGQKDIYYGILPDHGGECAGFCGFDKDPVNNLILSSSHELAETITDPETNFDNEVSWKDPEPSKGEIADICAGLTWSVSGIDGKRIPVVQTWSIKKNRCVGDN